MQRRISKIVVFVLLAAAVSVLNREKTAWSQGCCGDSYTAAYDGYSVGYGSYSLGSFPYMTGYDPYSLGYYPYTAGYYPAYSSYYSYYSPFAGGCCGTSSCCGTGSCCGTSSCCGAGSCCSSGACCSSGCGSGGGSCCGAGYGPEGGSPKPKPKPVPDDNFRQRATPPSIDEPDTKPPGPAATRNPKADWTPPVVEQRSVWLALRLQERSVLHATGFAQPAIRPALQFRAPLPERLDPQAESWVGKPLDAKLVRN